MHTSVTMRKVPNVKSSRSGYVSAVMLMPTYTRSHILTDPAVRKLSANNSQSFRRVRRPVALAFAAMSSDKEAVTEVLMKYEAALNESSTEKVMELYAPDGVFMPQHKPVRRRCRGCARRVRRRL